MAVTIDIPEIAQLREEVDWLKGMVKELKGLVGAPKLKEWYNLKEAAEILLCSPQTVRRYIEEGLLEKNVYSRHIQIPRSSLEKFQKYATHSKN